MKTTATVTALLVLVSAFAWTASADPSISESTGRRLTINPPSSGSNSGQQSVKSIDSWLRWLLYRSRQQADKVLVFLSLLRIEKMPSTPSRVKDKVAKSLNGQFFGKASSKLSSDEELGGNDDFDDDMVFLEGRQASKRQPDDYGHMRYGKRDFDDYGHMRFGRRWRAPSTPALEVVTNALYKRGSSSSFYLFIRNIYMSPWCSCDPIN